MYCVVSTDLAIITAAKSRFYCLNAYFSWRHEAVARRSTINKMAISINTELCA
jgi:hypothetical protein